MHRQVLRLGETVLGKENPYTLSSMNNPGRSTEPSGSVFVPRRRPQCALGRLSALLFSLSLACPNGHYGTDWALNPTETPARLFVASLMSGAPTMSPTSDCKRQLPQCHILAGSGTDLMSQ
jgi:hypothetical protein